MGLDWVTAGVYLLVTPIAQGEQHELIKIVWRYNAYSRCFYIVCLFNRHRDIPSLKLL